VAALTALQFEERLNRYLYERAEEARAVRVGEKETSEQAEIVARYADLFTREQHDSLRTEEDAAVEDDRERLYRLREACLGGIVVAELAERSDRLENEFLAARVDFRGESVPLRSAQAMLAILDEYGDRNELGDLAADASARFNEDRHELMAAAETLDAELSRDPDPVGRSISGCPNLPPMGKPCTNTLAVTAGYSTFIQIDGRAVCLDTVVGMTNGVAPVQYRVRSPAQELVDASA